MYVGYGATNGLDIAAIICRIGAAWNFARFVHDCRERALTIQKPPRRTFYTIISDKDSPFCAISDAHPTPRNYPKNRESLAAIIAKVGRVGSRWAPRDFSRESWEIWRGYTRGRFGFYPRIRIPPFYDNLRPRMDFGKGATNAAPISAIRCRNGQLDIRQISP